MTNKLTKPVNGKDTQDAINNIIENKQEKLTSGVNIKTINNQSILGSGNINISGGGGTATDVQINGASITSNNIANIVTNTAYDSSTNKLATMSDVFSRNIGEIVQSTIPLTDAGLHLLDGSEIVNMGIYSNFFTKIQQLYNSGNYDDLFTTASDWQTSVDTYGVCGKFVYTAGLQIIKLPKIIGFTESTIDVTTLGDLTEAGLPDHLHVGQYKNPGTSGGNANGVGSGSGWFGWANRNTGYASANNPIYGNSDTVQPQSIKVLYYIVVANTTKTAVEVDIDEIATDLNGKADKDLGNVPTSKSILVDSYVNGTSGYRIYSDKYCEQWGTASISNGNTGLAVTLPKSYSDTDYCVLVTHREGSYGTTGMCANVLAVNQIKIYYNTTASRTMQWRTSGYLP